MAYGTLVDADAYHALRGNAAWGIATEAARNAALVRAADHVQLRYVQKMASVPNPAPIEFANAEYEAALLELATPGFFTKSHTPSEQKVLTKVEGIQWTLLPGAERGSALPTSSKVEEWLYPWSVSASITTAFVV